MARFEKKIFSDEQNATLEALREFRKITDEKSTEYTKKLNEYRKSIMNLLNVVNKELGIEIIEMIPDKSNTKQTSSKQSEKMLVYDDPNNYPQFKL